MSNRDHVEVAKGGGEYARARAGKGSGLGWTFKHTDGRGERERLMITALRRQETASKETKSSKINWLSRLSKCKQERGWGVDVERVLRRAAGADHRYHSVCVCVHRGT